MNVETKQIRSEGIIVYSTRGLLLTVLTARDSEASDHVGL